MAKTDRYAAILNVMIEIAKERGSESPGVDAATFAYDLIDAALSEAEVWGVDPSEIGLSGFDPMDLLRSKKKAA